MASKSSDVARTVKVELSVVAADGHSPGRVTSAGFRTENLRPYLTLSTNVTDMAYVLLDQVTHCWACEERSLPFVQLTFPVEYADNHLLNMFTGESKAWVE
jgi:hypothetical protein